jgi:hypothetical protein
MELIDKILSTDIHEAVEIYEEQIRKLGKELYGINCGSCGNRLIEIYIKLSKNGKQIMDHKKNRVAKLKEGVVLCVSDMGITWTNESLDFTDEAALKVLDKYKAMESRFEILPERPKQKQKKEVNQEVKKEEVKVEPKTK